MTFVSEICVARRGMSIYQRSRHDSQGKVIGGRKYANAPIMMIVDLCAEFFLGVGN